EPRPGFHPPHWRADADRLPLVALVGPAGRGAGVVLVCRHHGRPGAGSGRRWPRPHGDQYPARKRGGLAQPRFGKALRPPGDPRRQTPPVLRTPRGGMTSPDTFELARRVPRMAELTPPKRSEERR